MANGWLRAVVFPAASKERGVLPSGIVCSGSSKATVPCSALLRSAGQQVSEGKAGSICSMFCVPRGHILREAPRYIP